MGDVLKSLRNKRGKLETPRWLLFILGLSENVHTSSTSSLVKCGQEQQPL